jgi:hypothetical protein
LKTAELTGATLDYWVARALSDRHVRLLRADGDRIREDRCETRFSDRFGFDRFMPSIAWYEAGPLLDRFDGMVGRYHAYANQQPPLYVADMGVGLARYRAFGPTRIVAALRALVGAVFGGDVPDETPHWVPPFLEKTV